jgi:hypothetical protein
MKVDEMGRAWERSEMCIIFWLEYLKGGDHSEYLGVDGTIILDWILRKKVGKV